MSCFEVCLCLQYDNELIVYCYAAVLSILLSVVNQIMRQSVVRLIKTSLADDDLSFDTSYASVSFIEYTLNRACLLDADVMANVCLI